MGFKKYSGYEAIKGQMPVMWRVICAHKDFEHLDNPGLIMFETLKGIYDELLLWEGEYRKHSPDIQPEIIAARDFAYACELLYARFPCLDPKDVAGNKKHIGQLLDLYRHTLAKYEAM